MANKSFYIFLYILYNMGMGIRICSLSSGSSGNCVYVSSENTNLIIDAGISPLRLNKCLKIFGAELQKTDVFITHTHSDHIKYLANIGEYCRNVYCAKASANKLANCYLGDKLKILDSDIEIGDILVSHFEVSHDVPCVGYSFMHKSGKISLATDLGIVDNVVLDTIIGSDLVMIESNHDKKMLMANEKYPSYERESIIEASSLTSAQPWWSIIGSCTV